MLYSPVQCTYNSSEFFLLLLMGRSEWSDTKPAVRPGSCFAAQTSRLRHMVQSLLHVQQMISSLFCSHIFDLW